MNIKGLHLAALEQEAIKAECDQAALDYVRQFAPLLLAPPRGRDFKEGWIAGFEAGLKRCKAIVARAAKNRPKRNGVNVDENPFDLR